ncbi:MAG: Ig-like domain-containing protein [Polyangiaceae bacterium]|nr:Ig-like domain-containing protein [Polyangiaceae bacterium]
MTRRRSSVALVLVTLLSACLPGATAKPPQAPIRGELAPGPAPLSVPTEAGPLRVVFASPRDSAPHASEIAIVFNKPMRAVGADPSGPALPIEMTPNVPGKTKWVGTTAIKFIPEKPFAKATSFRVEIPKGIKSADGTQLDEGFTFSFTTERPDISGSEPDSNAIAVRPDAPITLYFNQQIQASEVSRTVTVVANKKKIPFAITEIEKDHAVLAPRTPLPRDTEITVHIDSSLRAAEGELTMGKAKEIRFRTLGPFAIANVKCTPHPTEKGACDPNGDHVGMTLTTPIPSELLEQAITIEPPTDSFYVYEIGGDENGPSELQINANFEPGKTYSIGVRSSIAGRPLRDVHGQFLGAQNKRKLRFGNLPAEVTFGATGIYWAAKKHVLPVGVLNAPEATISMLPIRRDELLERLVGHNKDLTALNGAKQRIVPGGKTNESNWQRILVDDLLPTPSTKGPILARASFRPAGTSEVAVVEREMQLTDIGMYTKTSPDEAVVWVTRLSSGSAISGARVDLYELPAKGQAKLLSTSRVDSTGLSLVPVRLGEPRPDRLAVVVEHGDDWAYQTIKTQRLAEPVGKLFTGRGIYRPGESVEIKGLVRLPVTSGLITPKEGEVIVRVTDSSHHEIARARRAFSRFGTFSAELPIPADAPLGLYHVDAKFARGRLRSRFSVDQYRPIESKAFASWDKDAYFEGDRSICVARGEHLYGAPMAGATAKIVVNRGYGSFSIPGLDHFSIGMHDAGPRNARIAQASGQLDAKGAFSLPVAAALPGQVTTEMITCQAEIMDLDRRVQIAEDSAIVHPADVYVALANPENYWIDPGKIIEPKALVVTPAGERRVAPVHIEMLYHTRKDDRSFEDRLLASCDVTSGQTLVGCSFQTPKEDPAPEDEIIIRATTKDSKGRTVASSYAHRIEALPTPAKPAASGANTPPPPPPPPPVEVEPPRLRIDMESWLEVGKTARVKLSSPFQEAAKAMVTFEREGIIWRRALELAPAGTITVLDVPVTPAMMPNVLVTVTAISKNDVKTDEAHVTVDASPRKLQVDVRTGKIRTEPGDTLDVDVIVTDAAGKPASGVEVTLWAVDEGSLMLTYYRTPNPWEALFSNRDLLVRSTNARDELLTTWMGRHRVKPPQVRMGATSVGSRRGDFRQTVAFLPDLVTGANGRVKRKINLPDGLTTYRFMAVAVAEDDRAGSGDAQVQTFKPFMARPTLPRVIRAGDEFEASVVLSTIDLPDGKATIAANAKGLFFRDSGRKVVDVGPDAPVEVKFPLRADRIGNVAFSVDASYASGRQSHSDNVDLQHQVLSPALLETVAVSGETSRAIAERIANLPGIRSDAGGLSVKLSPSPLTGMVSGLEQLVDYPHGCTEQTVSRLVPLLALRDIADAFQVSLGPTGRGGKQKTVPEALQNAVDSVLANQKRNGGFGLWATSEWTDPWVTVYALWGLSQASRRGYVVPKDALDRAVKAMEPMFDAIGPDADTLLLERAAFGLDVLASMGRGNEPKMKALFAERGRLSIESRALLLHAYATAFSEARNEMAALTADVSAAIRLTGTGAYVESGGTRNAFGSDIVATAMVLRAMVAVDKAFAVAPRLATYLLEARASGNYPTTHDAAWALLALDAYRKTLPEPKQNFDARVFLGNGLLADVHFAGEGLRGKTIHVPMQDVMKAAGGPLTFEVLGSGRLHYDVELSFARTDMPAEAVDAGFFVTKTLQRVSEFGESTAAVQKDEPTFVPGEVVVCEIEVVTPSPRSFVVLEDPIAGGFEAVSMDYREGGAWLAQLEASPADRREKRDDRMVYFIDALPAGITRFRYLVRAMHTGRFHAPPTRVEQMYDPTIFGHTAAMHVRVGH